MLFRRKGRSFKFHLLGLGSVEYAEISELITKNGGEVCDGRDPPIITLTNHDGYTGGEPVFDTEYIRECIEHGELLDLIDFKFGARGFYGCLMSQFVLGKNACPCIQHLGLCSSSTRIGPTREQSSTIIREHNYSQGDAAIVQRGEPAFSYIQERAVNTLQQGDEGSPKLSLTKISDCLHDRSLLLRDSPYHPDESYWPQELGYSIDENESSVTKTNEMMNNLEVRKNHIAVKAPEPISFEESSYVDNSYDSEEMVQEFPNLCVVKSATHIPDSDDFTSKIRIISDALLRPERVNEKIMNFHSQPAGVKDSEVYTAKQNAPPDENLNEVQSPNALVKGAQICDNLGVDAKKENENIIIKKDREFKMEETTSPPVNTIDTHISRAKVKEVEITGCIVRNISKENEGELNTRSERLQRGESPNFDRCGSPVFTSGRMKKRKSPPRKKVRLNQPVSGKSRTETAVSPTISGNQSNQVKTLGGGIVKDHAKIEVFSLTLSESDDDLIYDPEIPVIINRVQKSSANRNSSLKLQKTNSEKEVLRKDKQQTAGPSTKNNDNDDVEEIVISSDESNGGQSTPTKESNKNDQRKKSSKDTGRLDTSKNKPRVQTRLTLFRNGNSDLSSSDELPRSKRNNTSHETEKQNVKRKKGSKFAIWEQRQMVTYLIDKDSIESAMGYEIWKELIASGLLLHRTYQSLQTNFRKSIYPKIHKFEMSEESMRQFLMLRKS